MKIKHLSSDDFESVAKWQALHDQGPFKIRLRREDFPQAGFIIEDLAAAFLMTTNSKTCFIEGFVSNPEAPIVKRARAVQLLIYDLILRAEKLGYHQVIAFTSKDSMIRELMNNDMVPSPESYCCLVKRFR